MESTPRRSAIDSTTRNATVEEAEYSVLDETSARMRADDLAMTR